MKRAKGTVRSKRSATSAAVILEAVDLLLGFPAALHRGEFPRISRAGVSMGTKPKDRKVRSRVSVSRRRSISASAENRGSLEDGALL
jgi:hypothetical protein